MTSATEVLVSLGSDGTAPMLGSYPYKAMNGEQPREVWYEELYRISAKDNQDFHDLLESCTEHILGTFLGIDSLFRFAHLSVGDMQC